MTCALPDRDRRAWPEGRTSRRGGVACPAALARAQFHRRVSAHAGAAGISLSTVHYRCRPPRGVKGTLATDVTAAGDLSRQLFRVVLGARRRRFFVESETQLVDGTPDGRTGTPVTWTEEQTTSSAVGLYRQAADYHANPDFIAPETRRNEVISFVSGGWTTMSISRAPRLTGVCRCLTPDRVMASGSTRR